jgi:hypothetical protein
MTAIRYLKSPRRHGLLGPDAVLSDNTYRHYEESCCLHLQGSIPCPLSNTYDKSNYGSNTVGIGRNMWHWCGSGDSQNESSNFYIDVASRCRATGSNWLKLRRKCKENAREAFSIRISDNTLSVRLYVWMCASLTSERLDGLYSCSVFMRFSVLDRCPINMEILSANISARYNGPNTRNGKLSRKRLERF